jgi:hypothetical protein
MLETIQGQNDVINRLIGVFTHSQSERIFTDNLINELEKVKGVIHDQIRN